MDAIRAYKGAAKLSHAWRLSRYRHSHKDQLRAYESPQVILDREARIAYYRLRAEQRLHLFTDSPFAWSVDDEEFDPVAIAAQFGFARGECGSSAVGD